MRTWVWSGGLALVAIGACAPGARSDLDVRAGVVVSDVDWGEALLIGALGEFFGLETSVVGLYHQQGMPLPDMLMAAYLARLAQADYPRVAALRSQGRGWGRIAKDLGMDPGTFNKLRKGLDPEGVDDADFEEAVLIWFLSEYYGHPQDRLLDLRRVEPPLGVLIALDLAGKSGKPLDEVLRERERAGSWGDVAITIGLADDARRRPVRPCGGAEFRRGLDITAGVVLSDLDVGEALLLGAVGEFFGLDPTVVLIGGTRPPPPAVLATAYLAGLAGADIGRVAGLRAQGHGWGRIANDLGIHPGTLNKLRNGFDIGQADDIDFEEAVLVWFLSEYYGQPPMTVVGKGQPLLSILLALDLSSRSGQSVDDLLGARGSTGSWRDVAGGLGIAGSDLGKPAKPKHGHGAGQSGGGADQTAGQEGPDRGHGRGGRQDDDKAGRGPRDR